jgi:hypothetical protein
MASTDNAIIGAIPGYNSNIDPTGQYANKLMSNINTVILEPCGYALNLSGAIPFIGDTVSSAINNSTTGDNTLFKIGQNVNSSIGLGDTQYVSTETALQIWSNILSGVYASQSNIPKECQISTSVNKLELLCTNDSTFTEVFSNNYKPSWLDEGTSGIANNISGYNATLGKLVSKLKGAKNIVSSFDSDAGRAVMKMTTDAAGKGGDLLSILASKSLGYQTTMPKEWANSNYDNGLQLMIRLVSPSGHYLDVFKYIVRPLMYLIAAAAPITYNGVAFGFPPLWRVYAQGLQTMNIAAISTLTIQRGGTDTIFNKFNQPLNVDVRLSLESIINGYATGIASSKDKSFYGSMTDETRPSIVTNSKDIIDSFTYLSGANGDSTAKEISVKL